MMAIVAFVLALGAGPAAARPAAVAALTLRGAAGLGFSAAELEQAVALRVPAGTAADLQVVAGADLRRVEVILGRQRRWVALGDRRGGAAARWVALTVVDLIQGEAAPPLLPEPPPERPPAARAILVLFPAISFSTRQGALVVTGGLGGSLRLYRGLRWTVDASYGGGPEQGVGQVQTALQVLPLRSGPAWRFTRVPIEVRLAGLAAPYWVRATAGSQIAEHQGVVGAVTAAGFAYLPLHRRLLAMLAIGGDLFINQVEFLAAGQPVFATPRFTVWLGAGLALRSSI